MTAACHFVEGVIEEHRADACPVHRLEVMRHSIHLLHGNKTGEQAGTEGNMSKWDGLFGLAIYKP